jgi:hypothetical protein
MLEKVEVQSLIKPLIKIMESKGHWKNCPLKAKRIFLNILSIRQKMSDIVCCFVHFYIVSADCMDRIALDEIDRNRWTGDLIRT